MAGTYKYLSPTLENTTDDKRPRFQRRVTFINVLEVPLLHHLDTVEALQEISIRRKISQMSKVPSEGSSYWKIGVT